MGRREGDEVVQMYVRDEKSSVGRPVKELAAFARVRLAAGETKTVQLRVGPEALALWDRQMKRVVEPGWFTITVGPSAASGEILRLEVAALRRPRRGAR